MLMMLMMMTMMMILPRLLNQHWHWTCGQPPRWTHPWHRYQRHSHSTREAPHCPPPPPRIRSRRTRQRQGSWHAGTRAATRPRARACETRGRRVDAATRRGTATQTMLMTMTTTTTTTTRRTLMTRLLTNLQLAVAVARVQTRWGKCEIVMMARSKNRAALARRRKNPARQIRRLMRHAAIRRANRRWEAPSSARYSRATDCSSGSEAAENTVAARGEGTARAICSEWMTNQY
jgi:hypothetical protein